MLTSASAHISSDIENANNNILGRDRFSVPCAATLPSCRQAPYPRFFKTSSTPSMSRTWILRLSSAVLLAPRSTDPETAPSRPEPSEDRTASTLERRLEKFEGLNRGDGSPTNHCNGRFRVGGKSKRVPVHRSVKQYSRCRRSPMSKRRPWEKRPVTYKVRALQPPAQRARQPDHHTDDCIARVVRVLCLAVGRTLERTTHGGCSCRRYS
jgi:hypothetical protein